MNALSAKDENLDFETWARLLIYRKVPDGYRHLINHEVVHHGAAILEHGGAFEVRICNHMAHQEILITPFPTPVAR